VPVLIDTVAWVRVENGRILCARPRGKDVFYIPGGKREGTESDLQVLLREIAEELAVTLLPGTVRQAGTYQAAQRDGQAERVLVRMSCYTADYSGTLTASSEIAEFGWFGYAECRPSTSCSSTTSRPRASCTDPLRPVRAARSAGADGPFWPRSACGTVPTPFGVACAGVLVPGGARRVGLTRGRRHWPRRFQGRASYTRLKGVSAARRKRVKPAAVTTSLILASPAWAPSASPTSWDSEAGVHSSVENA